MTDEEPIDNAQRQRLPDWVERELARRHGYWRVLRDGGVITAEEAVQAMRRETEDLPE